MNTRRRVASLERRMPEPAGREPEPIDLPSVEEFQTLPFAEQRYLLLCWQPPPSEVRMPPLDEIPRLPLEELRRLSEAIEGPGRDILLPYLKVLPLDLRLQLTREAVNLEIWRYSTFRTACHPSYLQKHMSIVGCGDNSTKRPENPMLLDG